MCKLAIAMCLLAAAGTSSAAIPMLNYTCPGNLDVHADEGGPVFINGKETKLKRFNDNYYEASGAGVTLSISINPDGTPTVSYTGPKRANGICHVASSASTGPAPATARNSKPNAENACLAAVAKSTNVARNNLKVIDVMTAEAGTGVTVSVPGANAPWSCLVDRQGRVERAMYTGKEGGR
ncbi:hypothetical protein QTH91_20150 [Variovorax dokdonensis]|uniref:Lipoprotein n=1 Tax=Variovorax dokdonensis TaxID=344883 RepID=A0ABT7NFT2_9BURK|nr:hypothetical protein [Variovorax dokdonensis]MDM0046815.1 hypothetical protein [Variovorax dokdonensis]